jgi:hypothetical protein
MVVILFIGSLLSSLIIPVGLYGIGWRAFCLFALFDWIYCLIPYGCSNARNRRRDRYAVMLVSATIAIQAELAKSVLS